MRDRSPVFVALADLLLCCLSVVVVAVNPKAPAGELPKAEFLITASWPPTLDADVDLLALTPARMPLYYRTRQIGCASLDQDNRGWQSRSEPKETLTIRCIAAGRWDFGVNLFTYESHPQAPLSEGSLAIPVHVEVIKLNPSVRSLFTGTVTLVHRSQTINVVSVEIAPNGDAKLVKPSLTPLSEQMSTP